MKDFICLLCSFPNEYNHFENKIPIYPVHCFNLISLNTTWNVFWMNKLLKQVWLFLSIFFGLKRQKNLKWQKKKKKVLVSSLKSLYLSWRDSYHKTRSSGCLHQLCLFGDSYITKFCVMAALVSKWVAFPQEPNLFLLGHALVTSTWLPARRKKLLNQNLTDDS